MEDCSVEHPAATLPPCQNSSLTLCDYFAVVGFDKPAGLQVDKFAELAADLARPSTDYSSLESGYTSLPSKSPLDRAYQAKVLAHYPNQRDGFPFAYESASLCMPKGLKFYTERKVPKEPSFHSFVVVREDGSKVNGCSLLFYEELLDNKIRQQIYDLQMEHVRQMTASTSSTTIAQDCGTETNAPFPTRHNNHHPPGQVTFGIHTMPRKQSSKRGRSTPSNKSKRVSYYDSATNPIFVSKCLCLITRIPIVYSSENLLRHLWTVCQRGKSVLADTTGELPMESLIYWALHEVPLPIPGTCLQISAGACHLVVKRPSNNELSFFDYPIQSLFNYISVDKFLKLFTCFLLEHQILLCSKYMDRLMLTAECLCTLVFPFRWQLTYVPILPYSQLKFIEAPVPYVMGLCYDDKIPEQIYQSNVCVFDIDAGQLDHPEDIAPLPRQRQIALEIENILKKFRTAKPASVQPTTSPTATSAVKPACTPPPKDPSPIVQSNNSRPVVVMRRKHNEDGNKSSRNHCSNRQGDLWNMKRMSRSFENNLSFDALAAEIEALEGQEQTPPPAEIKYSSEETNPSVQPDPSSAYLRGLKFNQAIRELFLHHFASLFACYENFLLGSRASMLEENRESMVNFDKASFLSDQPDSYLPFLAAFLETQMFTSFVDSKILSQCPQLYQSGVEGDIKNEYGSIAYFDRKIDSLSVEISNTGAPKTPDRQPLDFFTSPGISALLQAAANSCDEPLTADYEVPQPHLLDGKANGAQKVVYDGIFPELDTSLFELKVEGQKSVGGVAGGASVLCSPWKQQHHINTKKQRVLSVLEDAANRLSAPDNDIKVVETPMKVAHQNWKFVEQLLRETKTKTKRMLVAKMGKEAVHLGHGDMSISGVEENTLVAGFCDLLERVWAHGLKKKQGKSALWANIFAHHDREKFDSMKQVDRYSNLSPDFNPHFNLPPSPMPISQIKAAVQVEQNYSTEKVVPIPQESFQHSHTDDSKILSDLLDSIKSLAKSLEDPLNNQQDVKVVDEDESKMQHLQSANAISTSSALNKNSASNWQNSLLKAANFICDKVSDKIISTAGVVAPAPELARRPSWTKEEEKERAKETGELTKARSRDDSRARFYHHETKYERRREKDVNGNKEQRKSGRSREGRTNNNNGSLVSRGEEVGRQPKFIDGSTRQSPMTGMKKSNSMADFAPHWSSNALSSLNGSHGKSRGDITTKNPLQSPARQPRDGSLSARSAVSEVQPQKQHSRNSSRRSLSRPRSPARHRRASGSGVDLERNFAPLPTKMAYDLKNVMRMTEIKTDIGLARAFVRLALERKLLHKHLKSVLSNTHLLQKMYKRYAFLRCEDEREQFLYHVLSLNAVDFSCFTHTFISTKMHYEVLLVAGIDRFCSSSVWIMLTGSLGSTSNIFLPQNSLQFTFDYKNLGILSTLRIGQSNDGGRGAHPSKWFLEYVLVRNNITAQTFCFNCGRWFGRGVDDGALERLLVAEHYSATGNREGTIDSELMDMESSFYSSSSAAGGGGGFGFNSLMSRPESPVSGVSLNSSVGHKNNFYYNTGSLARRRRSPSVSRSSLTENYGGARQSAPRITELQHKLGVCVNALVKHFFTEHKDFRSGARLTPLLCGEIGLVSCLEQVFEMGRQDTLFSNRFFRQPYPWDYIEKVFDWFANFFRNGESQKLTREQRTFIVYAYNLVVKISANTAVGKEGKFHIFVLLTLKDHVLSGLLPLMAWTPVTKQMYDESAFLNQPHHLSYLSKLLNSLNEFHFMLEKSLTYGIE